MFIQNQFEDYIIYKEKSIKNALDKIDFNKSGFLIVVNKQLKVIGIMTDGDFRRWLIKSNDKDLNQSVINASNKKFIYKTYNSRNKDLREIFRNDIKFLPLLDKALRLKGIAFKNFFIRLFLNTSQYYVLLLRIYNHVARNYLR